MAAILRLLLVTLALIGLTTPIEAQHEQTAADEEIATAPVLPALAAMNQTMTQVGTAPGRVTQAALMVNRIFVSTKLSV